MTLIAAFKVANAVVVCADRQETVGDYRVTVDKLQPQDIGPFELVIGGSGDTHLVEGLAEAITMKLGSLSSAVSEIEIRSAIRSELLSFHRDEVALSPTANIHLEFVVCLRRKGDGEVFLWKLRGPTIVGITNYALLGWDEAIYEHEVKKLYRPNLPIVEGVSIGVALFTLAKATSNYVGGDTQVIVVNRDGMAVAETQMIRQIESNQRQLNEALVRFEFQLTDPTVSLELFDRSVQTILSGFRALKASTIEDLAKGDANLPLGQRASED